MPIDADNIFIVNDAFPQERHELLVILGELGQAEWTWPTECPSYSVKGIATHILGDDLSLLSRQRDRAVPALVFVAEEKRGEDFGTLLDAFNDQWVHAASFLSPALLLELLRINGEWTAHYFSSVDPNVWGERVPLFDPLPGDSSPYWQAIAREFIERWTHHSQIRRALGLRALATPQALEIGVEIFSTVVGLPMTRPASSGEPWKIGTIVLGDSQQAADILTLAHTESELRKLLDGPIDLVHQFASRCGRRR